jgi:7-keto-8-aminopelargonate synthetase-like enzyme
MSPPRISARITLRAEALVVVGGEALSYEVSNLSVGGALLSAGPALDIGQAVFAEFYVGHGEPVGVEASVIRLDQLPNGQPAYGIAFRELPADVVAKLTDVVTRGYQALGARVLGQVRRDLQARGITDLRQVAQVLQEQKEEQARAHLFASDLFTEHGSDTLAPIVSGTTGQSRECIVWSLNLYLGLNREPRVIERTQRAVAEFGTGCGTSAPSGGMSRLHNQLERRVAELVGKPRAILFSTGYAANLGALSALPGPKDLILLDREAHASMIDGVKLGGRKWLAFKHNDVADLAEKLERYGHHHENVFVAVESAYSMSGDLAPLREIAALKRNHRFFLYVDEAHTFGMYGKNGAGYCAEQGVTDDVDFIMSTFSKSTASIGGFLAAEPQYCTVVQATSSPYVFQACLTPPDAATILASLDEMREHPEHAARLHENNATMRAMLQQQGFDLGESRSPVIPVYVPDLEKLYKLCAALYMDGIFSVPVVYPAVGPDEGRIRFIVNARHTREQIETTVTSLARNARALGVFSR